MRGSTLDTYRQIQTSKIVPRAKRVKTVKGLSRRGRHQRDCLLIFLVCIGRQFVLLILFIMYFPNAEFEPLYLM